MSQRLLKTRPVQGSEWMILVRDYQINVTAYEFAVGSLYGTCGHWGEQVFLSDVAVADILHIKRETAAKARKGLLAKGLIEDIGQHGTQPQQREYRLTVPVEMPPRRKVRGDVPETGTPCPPNGHPHVPETGTGVSPDRAQHLEVELEEELEIINITPDDDGRQASSDQGQGQNPRPPGADDPDDDRPWVDWDDPDDGGSIAADLGVPVESIGQPFRAWLEEYLTSVEFDPGMKADWPAFSASIKKAAGRPSPVGYLEDDPARPRGHGPHEARAGCRRGPRGARAGCGGPGRPGARRARAVDVHREHAGQDPGNDHRQRAAQCAANGERLRPAHPRCAGPSGRVVQPGVHGVLSP